MTPRSKAGPALSNDPQSGELSEGPHPQDKKCGSCQDRARKVAWHLAGLDGHRWMAGGPHSGGEPASIPLKPTM